MLYALGENLMGRGVASNPPPLYVRGLISFIDLFCHKLLNYLLIGFLYVNLKMCMYCSSLCHTRFSVHNIY